MTMPRRTGANITPLLGILDEKVRRWLPPPALLDRDSSLDARVH